MGKETEGLYAKKGGDPGRLVWNTNSVLLEEVLAAHKKEYPNDPPSQIRISIDTSDGVDLVTAPKRSS